MKKLAHLKKKEKLKEKLKESTYRKNISDEIAMFLTKRSKSNKSCIPVLIFSTTAFIIILN